MYVEEHGGACCGICHLYDFPRFANVENIKELKWEIRGIILDKGRGVAIECVITNRQKQWAPILRKIGFKKVFQWKNPNSGNTCNQYILNTRQVRMSDLK